MMGLSIWLVWPLFLTQVWGYLLLKAGLAITPGPDALAAAGITVGRLADRHGPWCRSPSVRCSPSCRCCGWCGASGPNRTTSARSCPPPSCSRSGSVSRSPRSTVPRLRGVDASAFGEVNATFNTVRNLGGGLGVAIVVALLGNDRPIPFDRFDHTFLRHGVPRHRAGGRHRPVLTPGAQGPVLTRTCRATTRRSTSMAKVIAGSGDRGTVATSESLIDTRAGWPTVISTFLATFTVFGVAYSFGAFSSSPWPMSSAATAGRLHLFSSSITTFLYFAFGVVTGRVGRTGSARARSWRSVRCSWWPGCWRRHGCSRCGWATSPTRWAWASAWRAPTCRWSPRRAGGST